MTQELLSLNKASLSSSRAKRNLIEKVVRWILFLAAVFSVGVTISIVWILVEESLLFFQKVSLWDFLTDPQWTPLFSDRHYGIRPLLSGTLVTSLVALLISIPLGTVAALYLSEFACDRLREIIKPCLELLAAVPTVVYGYFALLVVTPLLQIIFPDLGGFNRFSPGLVMGLMIIPFITSISEDAMRSVPVSLKEGSYAMGATRLQTAFKVVFPAAISGVIAAYILAASRAVGVTMVVAIAAGLQPNLNWNPFEQGATITAYIAQVSLGDLPHGSLEYQTIFAAGLTLVIITLILNIFGHFLAKRYREIY